VNYYIESSDAFHYVVQTKRNLMVHDCLAIYYELKNQCNNRE
jgi:hypothetical protein